MTFLTKDINDHLKGSAAILSVFSNRIFPKVIPQDFRDGSGKPASPYPCLVLNITSNEPEYYLGGEVGRHVSKIQVDVWTDGTGGEQKENEYGELVRNRLNGYRGQFGTGCYGTARMIRNTPIPSPPVDGSENWHRRASMDFEINHSADVPTFA